MMRGLWLSLVMFVLSLVAVEAVAGSGCASFDQAMAACQAVLANPANSYQDPTYYSPGAACQVKPGSTSTLGSIGIWAYWIRGAYWSFQGAWSFSCPAGFNTGCPGLQGQSVPSGTSYEYYQASGESCANSCEMALAVGAGQSTQFVYNGQQCASSASTATKSGLLPKVQAETTNADGSKTDCDPISGKCVTFSPGQQTVPTSTDGGDHSTSSNSTTSNPATSSSSTSTTTTTATGSGGTGSSGTGSSTSVTQSTTSTPASASSTASKCDTGVCDVGDADGDTGTLYSASTDTPSSVYANFQSQVSSAPIVSAVTGFFTVQVSGTCPTWHIPGNKYWGASGFDFTWFCNSDLLAIMAFAGYVVLALAAFCALRIAIY